MGQNTELMDFTDELMNQYQNILGEKDTEKKSAEQVIDWIVGYYEGVIACMPGNVYWLDKDCNAVGCNQNVLDMFGFKSLAQFKGLTFEEMGELGNWHPEATQSFKKDTLEVIKTAKAKLNVEEPPIPHDDGRIIYFLTSRVPLFDRKGAVVGVVGISIDITERKQQEEALRLAKEKAEAADKAKSEFIANMRHDLRTPLTGIISFAETFREKSKNTPLALYADNVFASSKSFLEFIDNILEVINITTGELPFLKKKFNIVHQIESLVSLLKAKASEKKLNFSFYYPENISQYLVGDPQRIQRLTLELLTNALKFTNEGSVKISVDVIKKEAQNAVIQLTVEDTGIGIPEDKKEEIFLRFTRLSPSYKGIYKGAGLGLSIVKQFVDDLEGEIYVNSEINKGTTFIVLLPCKIALIEDASKIDEMPVRVGLLDIESISLPEQNDDVVTNDTTEHSRILLIEDSKIVALSTKQTLETLDCTVDIAYTGRRGVSLALERHYDLIFMDIGLPDITGHEATQKIRDKEGQNKHVPIIALTAHLDMEEKKACVDAGMNASFPKPLPRAVAMDILNAFIPKRAARIAAAFKEAEKEEKPSGEHELLNLIGKALDFKSLAKTYNSKEIVTEILELFHECLVEDKEILISSKQNSDWEGIKKIAHKIAGGAVYCGAERLHKACIHLEKYLKADEKTLREPLYEQLLKEIDSTKDKVAELI